MDATSSAPPSTAACCPHCGERGAVVPGHTVKALLAVSLRRLQAPSYWFCATPDCSVVYFAPEHSQYFTVVDVRVAVYQKAPDDAATPVCYCFGHTVGDTRDATHASLQIVIDDITHGIRQDQCACDLRNPQGACCLGNVRRFLHPQAKPNT
jgi:hypothetical protein